MLGACSQSSPASDPKVVAANELTLVGDMLFVAATTKDELKILDLDARWAVSTFGRRFWPAPNPIEQLSIPVLSRPRVLAHDVGYGDYTDADTGLVIPRGAETAGPYVYAASPGVAAISIVSAAPDDLVEVMRLLTSAPVTAVAGELRATSRLYWGQFDGSAGELRHLDLGPPATLKSEDAAVVTRRQVLVARFPGESIAAVLPIPGDRVVIATRAAQGNSGRVLVLDLATLATRELHFPGAVRTLVTHPAIAVAGSVIGPGERIFGVFDEPAGCVTGCSGVLSVDVSTGESSVDSNGVPMAPVRFGKSLIAGLALGPRLKALVPVTDATQQLFALLGIATSTDGWVHFFDAAGLHPIDIDSSVARVTAIEYRGPPTAEFPNGAPADYVEGPTRDDANTPSVDETSVKVLNGAAPDETITVTVEGVVPGFEALATSSADGAVLAAPARAPDWVQAGDAVVFSDAVGVCGEALVDSVAAAKIVVSSVPAACGARVRYAVRAGGSKPYVVVGSVSGALGRAAKAATAAFGTVWFDRSIAATAGPTYQITFGAGAGVPRDARWVLTVVSGFHEFSFVSTAANAATTAAACSLALPQAIAVHPVQKKVFVSFPATNGGIAELNPVPQQNYAPFEACYR